MRSAGKICFILLCLNPIFLMGEDQDTYFRDKVEPILKENCYDCHSHSSRTMEANLTLDWKTGWLKGGDRGPAIVPGKPEESLLVHAINHTNPELMMPDEKLSDEDIRTITTWIKKGAHDPRTTKPSGENTFDTDWWSLKPLVLKSLPWEMEIPLTHSSWRN